MIDREQKTSGARHQHAPKEPVIGDAGGSFSGADFGILIGGTAEEIAARLSMMPAGQRDQVIAELSAMRGSAFVGAVLDQMKQTGAAPPPGQQFKGPAPVPIVETRPPIVAGEPIGNQQAHDPREGSHPDYGAAAEATRQGYDVDVKRAQLERAQPTLDVGGSPPHFVTQGTTRIDTYQSGWRTVPIQYIPRFFHVPNAILHDIALAKSTEEIEAVWRVYLSNVSGAPEFPWDPLREKQNHHHRRGKTKLPDGAAAHDIERRIVEWETWEKDTGGGIRRGLLKIAILDRVPEVEGLSELMTGNPTSTEQTDEADKKRVIPTLRLPLTKAPHIFAYWQALSEGKLVHDKKYARDQPAQRQTWKNVMLSQVVTRMPPDLLTRGRELATLDELIIPSWSRVNDGVEMEVDHIVELQVTRPEDRSEFDSIRNYELLDSSANASVGSKLRHAIKRERERLAAESGDPGWLERPITFQEVNLEGGGPMGERWTQEEIAAGDHVVALQKLRGGR